MRTTPEILSALVRLKETRRSSVSKMLSLNTDMQRTHNRFTPFVRAYVVKPQDSKSLISLMLQRRSGIEKRVLTESPTMQMSDLPSSVHQVVWKAEQQSINAAMREAEGDVQAAAKLLGVSRATLYRKLQRQASTYLKEQDLVSLDAQKS